MATLEELLEEIRRYPRRYSATFLVFLLFIALGAGIFGIRGCEIDPPTRPSGESEDEEAVLGGPPGASPDPAAAGTCSPIDPILIRCTWVHARTRKLAESCLGIPRLRFSGPLGDSELRYHCGGSRVRVTVHCEEPYDREEILDERYYCAFGAPWRDYVTQLSCERVEQCPDPANPGP